MDWECFRSRSERKYVSSDVHAVDRRSIKIMMLHSLFFSAIFIDKIFQNSGLIIRLARARI